MVRLTQMSFGRGILALSVVMWLVVPGESRARARSGPLYAIDSIIPHPMTVLLRNESIVRELRLDMDQRAAVERALDDVELPLWRLRDRPTEEGAGEARLLLARLERALSETLTSRQIERFNQILLQAQGMRSLLAPEVAERLSLTANQTQRVRAVLDALQTELANTRQQDPSSAPRIQAQAEREAVATLNSRQRRKLLSLMGEGFDLTRIRNIACRAPELNGVTAWIDSDATPREELRGRVIVVHFYAFGCINCIRNLPHYNAWRDRFPSTQIAIVGIHTPETESERDIARVREKAAEAGIAYPVAVDNDRKNWDAWANNVWPAVYLIDKQGFVRYWWYGELNWQGSQGEKWMRSKIVELLGEQPPVLTAQASQSPHRQEQPRHDNSPVTILVDGSGGSVLY